MPFFASNLDFLSVNVICSHWGSVVSYNSIPVVVGMPKRIYIVPIFRDRLSGRSSGNEELKELFHTIAIAWQLGIQANDCNRLCHSQGR